MNKSELLKRIEALEMRVRMLESRPIVYPVQQPIIPYQPMPVWCKGATA